MHITNINKTDSSSIGTLNSTRSGSYTTILNQAQPQGPITNTRLICENFTNVAGTFDFFLIFNTLTKKYSFYKIPASENIKMWEFPRIIAHTAQSRKVAQDYFPTKYEFTKETYTHKP